MSQSIGECRRQHDSARKVKTVDSADASDKHKDSTSLRPGRPERTQDDDGHHVRLNFSQRVRTGVGEVETTGLIHTYVCHETTIGVLEIEATAF